MQAQSDYSNLVILLYRAYAVWITKKRLILSFLGTFYLVRCLLHHAALIRLFSSTGYHRCWFVLRKQIPKTYHEYVRNLLLVDIC